MYTPGYANSKIHRRSISQKDFLDLIEKSPSKFQNDLISSFHIKQSTHVYPKPMFTLISSPYLIKKKPSSLTKNNAAVTPSSLKVTANDPNTNTGKKHKRRGSVLLNHQESNMQMLPTNQQQQDAALFLKRKSLRQSLYLNSTSSNGNGNGSSSNPNQIKTSPSRKIMTKSKSFVISHRRSSIPLSPARYMMLASASSSKNRNLMSSQHGQKVNGDKLQNYPTPSAKKSKSSHKNKEQAENNSNNNSQIYHPVVLSSKSLCSTTQNEISPINNSDNNKYQNIESEQRHQCQRMNQQQHINNTKNGKINNRPSISVVNGQSNAHPSPSISTPSPPRKGILKQPKTPTYPVFHNFQLCTAQPGTEEWKQYWEKYDKTLAEYKKSEQQYLEDHHEYRTDLEKYKQEAARLQEQDTMFRQSIGLEQKKTAEIINHPLTGLTTVNGFVFDRSGGPTDGLNAFLSSVGTTGFRLEIDVRGYDKDSIKIDKEYNLMKIQVPIMDHQKSRHKTIVIGVPSDHNLNDVDIYPIVNGWLIVEMSPDKINITNTSLL